MNSPITEKYMRDVDEYMLAKRENPIFRKIFLIIDLAARETGMSFYEMYYMASQKIEAQKRAEGWNAERRYRSETAKNPPESIFYSI